MQSIRSKFMSLSIAPGLTDLFHNVWPVGIGVTLGNSVSQAADWHNPWLTAALTGALVQVLIALLRSWFSERRDLLQTMKQMLGEQRQYLHDIISTEKRERHDMANRAQVAEFKLALVARGVPLDQLPTPVPLYPEKEDVDRNKT